MTNFVVHANLTPAPAAYAQVQQADADQAHRSDALCVVYALGGQPHSLQPFAHSTNRHGWFFTFVRGDETFFVKLPAAAEKQNFAQEIEATCVAATAGLAPPAWSVVTPQALVTKRISNGALKPSSIGDRQVRAALLGRWRALQQLPTATLRRPVKDVYDTAQESCLRAKSEGSRGSMDLDAVQAFLARAKAEALSTPRTKQVVHGDFWHENILQDAAGKLWVIDWGAAHLGDPLEDLARFAVLSDLPLHEEKQFLRQAEQRQPTAESGKRFGTYLAVLEADFVCYLARKDADVAGKPTLNRMWDRLLARQLVELS